MSITAKVKKRVIDTGRIFDVLVQGENRSHTIIFAIPNETMQVSGTDVALKDCYFYLLYKRKGDEVPQIPLLLTKAYDLSTDTISASFEPTSYFTEKEGALEVQIFACSTDQSFTTVDVDIEDIALWTTFTAQISISKSQLKNSQTIVAEDMFTKGIAEMSAFLDSAESEADDAEEYASDAEEFAKGTRSDGLTVPHVSTGAHDNAKDYKDLAKDWASKTGGTVESGEYSAKYYAIVSDTRSQESEAYALGTKGGTPVPAFADKNAKDWATKTGSTVDGTNYSSKQYAINAKASADIVEEHATAIDSIYADLTNIDAVATDIQDEDSIINTVAESIQDVNAVAGSITDVNTVAGKATQITTVAGIASNVTTVAGIASDVTAVAGIASDVSAVEDIKTDVSAVASIDDDVSAVASIKNDVSAVATIDDDVTTVATDISDVSTVASDITKVTAVADDLTNIDAVADDLTNIDNAVDYALEAEGWANGTQNGTPVSSGSPYYENNAKYWADAVPALQAKVNANSARITNLEQKAGDYTTVQYRGTNAVPTGKAKNGLVESIVGKTRAWNQLASIALGTYKGVTISMDSDGVCSLSGTINNTSCFLVQSRQYLEGHKYLIIFDLLANPNSVSFTFGAGKGDDPWWTNLSAVGRTAEIVINTYNTAISLYDLTIGTDMSGIKLRVLIRDLTLIFGSGNEPSTVSDALAQLPALGQYNAYDAGSLVDTKVSGVKSVGVNIWDEEWEVGKLNPSTGGLDSSSTNIRSKNYVSISSAQNYCFHGDYGLNVCYFDKNKNFLSFAWGATDTVRQTPYNAVFLKFYMSNSYGTTYNNDIQISEVHGSVSTVNTTYHPYKTDTLSLSETVTLKSAGSVADTDELNVEVLVDGVKVNRRRRTVRTNEADLGQCDWYYDSDYSVMRTNSLTDMSIAENWSALICAKYFVVSSNTAYSDMPDKSCKRQATTASFVIKDSDLTVSDIVNNKIAKLLGVKLTYETATYSVTLLDPIIDNFLEVEGGGTVETIQTQTPVIDNCLDVGYLTL